MSYSVCLNCESAVWYYQKYCKKCEDIYNQDEMFWKTHGYEHYSEPLRTEHKKKDLKKGSHHKGIAPSDVYSEELTDLAGTVSPLGEAILKIIGGNKK